MPTTSGVLPGVKQDPMKGRQCFSLSFSFILTCVIDLFFLVSKSSHWLSNSQMFNYIDIWRSTVEAKNGLIYTEFKKINLKKLLLPHAPTVLLENLHKGTSQEWKKLDECRFLNLCIFLRIARQSSTNRESCQFDRF